MAKIVLSDAAPEDAVHFSLGGAEIDVPFETRDRETLSNASVHPWLEVEYDEAEALGGDFITRQPAPADDPLSAVNDVSNDPDAVRAEQERREAEYAPLAVDSALDQSEPVNVGPVAVTLAADDTDDDDGERY